MEQWAEIRRMHFVQGLSIKRIAQAHRQGPKDDPEGDQELRAARLFRGRLQAEARYPPRADRCPAAR